LTAPLPACARRLVFLLGLLLLSLKAPSALASAPALFSAARPSDACGAATDPSVVRRRLVTIDLGLLLHADGSPRALGDHGTAVQLNLFEDASFTAVLEELTQTSPGGYSWSGRLAGIDLSSVVVVVERQVMAAQVSMPGAAYQVRYAGCGLHAASESDPGGFPPEAPPRAIDGKNAGRRDGPASRPVVARRRWSTGCGHTRSRWRRVDLSPRRKPM